jgi:hypothetical protein
MNPAHTASVNPSDPTVPTPVIETAHEANVNPAPAHSAMPKTLSATLAIVHAAGKGFVGRSEMFSCLNNVVH